MAHIVSNLISHTRAQFSDESHSILSNTHGHLFAVHAPPPKRTRQTSPPAETDPEELLAQKQQKIAAHNSRINALNNSKAKAPEDAEAEALK